MPRLKFLRNYLTISSMIFLKIGVVSAAIILAFVFTTTVQAGGGLISFEVVSSNPDMQPGDQYVVRPFVKTPEGKPAVNWPIRIYLDDYQPDDYIAQNDLKTDENGTIYAKIISKAPIGDRTIFAEVTMPDGTPYISSPYILDYTPQPKETPTIPTPDFPPPTLGLRVTFQKHYSESREVGLEWDNPEGVSQYNVYMKQTDSAAWGTPLISTNTYSTTLNLDLNRDYIIKAEACYPAGNCLTSDPMVIPAIAPSDELEPTIVVDKNIEQLYERINDLQSQLDESKQKQNELQKIIDRLLNFIKRLFPFFE